MSVMKVDIFGPKLIFHLTYEGYAFLIAVSTVVISQVRIHFFHYTKT